MTDLHEYSEGKPNAFPSASIFEAEKLHFLVAQIGIFNLEKWSYRADSFWGDKPFYTLMLSLMKPLPKDNFKVSLM